MINPKNRPWSGPEGICERTVLGRAGYVAVYILRGASLLRCYLYKATGIIKQIIRFVKSVFERHTEQCWQAPHPL